MDQYAVNGHLNLARENHKSTKLAQFKEPRQKTLSMLYARELFSKMSQQVNTTANTIAALSCPEPARFVSPRDRSPMNI
jgi:hypothetical protein